MPLHEIEQTWTRKVVQMKPFAVETLVKYMKVVTSLVEIAISDDLPDQFGLIFDGWTRFSVHFLAIFAVYSKESKKKQVLLAIAPPIDEESYSADEHVTFIQETLSIYRKSLENVCVLVGDNCSTNQSISRKTGIALIGCYSHKLNLAIKKHLLECSEGAAIKSVHNLMPELRKLKNAAKLRKLGVGAPKIDNETRWSSIYEMLKRYFEIIHVVETIETASIQEKLLSRQDHKKLEIVMVRLKQMEDITKELQRENITLSEARYLFDGVMDAFPDMEGHLHERGSIVVDPIFESAVIKVIRNQENSLNPSEKRKLSTMKRPNPMQQDEARNDDTLNFAQALLKRRRTSVGLETYPDLSFIPPTSNIVERLFSTAKLVLRDQRAALLPITFEMILFLKINCDWWDIQAVHKSMQSKN